MRLGVRCCRYEWRSGDGPPRAADAVMLLGRAFLHAGAEVMAISSMTMRKAPLEIDRGCRL